MKTSSPKVYGWVLHVSHQTFKRFAVVILTALVLGLFLLFTAWSNAGQLDSWRWRNATPFANTMNSLCFGSGKFVAVGDGGMIHTSGDGFTWDDGRRSVTSALNKVIYANGQFLAVGSGGTILTSPDGFQWTPRSSGTTNDLTAAAFGNGRFVVCGRGGRLVVSTNGINWQVGSDGTTDFEWITFGNGVFLISPAVDYVQTVRLSANGQNWSTSQAIQGQGLMWRIYGAQYGNGAFVLYSLRAITGGGVNRFYSSTDGTNWVECPFPVTQPGVPSLMSFGNGLFYVLGNSGAVRTSNGSDTTVWNLPSDSLDSFRCMTYGAGRHVMMAGMGQVWTSSNASNWLLGHSGFRSAIHQIIRGSNYVAIAASMPILISSNGNNFVQANSPAGIFSAVEYDGSNYVALGVTGNVIAGQTGEVYTSTNTVDWTRRTSNADKALTAACRGPGRWVVVGAAGTIITSPNTLAWTLRTAGTANHLNGVAYGNGTYVAVGNVGTVVSSPDGTSWDVQFSGTTEHLNAVQFLNGNFYAVGANGAIISSPDGSTWNAVSSGSTVTLKSVTHGNGYYLACGSYYFNGLVQGFLMSTNGVNWQDIQLKLPMSAAPRSAAFLDGSFWITGDTGALLRTDSADAVPFFAGQMLSGGVGFQLQFAVNTNAFQIQFRTNLITGDWQQLMTITNPVSPHTWIDTWTDSDATNSPVRFYRMAPWP